MTDTNNTDGAALLPVTQADRDAAAKCMERDRRVTTAEKMRFGQIDNNWLIQAFARHRISHSLPGDVATILDQAILWARDDKCSYPDDAEKFEQRIEILRAALTPPAPDAEEDDRSRLGKSIDTMDDATFEAAPSALSGDAGEGEHSELNADLCARITEYLCAGGLVNPELMDHKVVRDLLIDIREALRAEHRAALPSHQGAGE